MIEFFYIVLLSISVYALVRRLKQKTRLISDVFFAVFIVYYIITPTILGIYRGRITSFETYKTPYLVVFSQATELDRWRALIITYFVTAVLLLLRHVKFVQLSRRKEIPNETTIPYLEQNAIERVVYRTGVFFLAIGGMAILLLTRELGGIKRMLSLGSTIRGYLIDNTEYLSSLGAICKTLSSFVTGGFFCLFSVWIKRRTHTGVMLLSAVLSVISLLFDAGRGPLLLFFGCIFFTVIKLKGKKVAWLVVTGFVVIALMSSSIEVIMYNISVGNSPFYKLDYSMSENLLATITDLAYPYANLLLLPKLTSIGRYSFGTDYLLFFSEIIPKRLLWPILQYVPFPDLVTTKISQYYITSGLSIGGTPADFISFGWFQGNIIGILINCLFYS